MFGTPFPLCLEPWNPSLLALLGTLHLCQILWTVQNSAYLSAFIKSSEPWFFTCFYGLLGILILCLILWTAFSFILSLQLRTHMYWLHSPNSELLLCLKLCSLSAQNPGKLFFSAPYEKLGSLILCLFLLTARNPLSLPVSLDCGTQHLCLLLWKARNPDSFLSTSFGALELWRFQLDEILKKIPWAVSL